MKNILSLLFALSTVMFLSYCQRSGETPETASSPQVYTIEQFMDVVQMFGSSFSPDETKILVSSKETGIFNAYEIDIATGEKTALTNSEDNAIFAQTYFPEDERFIFSSDQGGNEITHIYVKAPDATPQDLTPDSTAKASFYGLSYDRSSFFFGSNKRDPRYFDLYKTNIEGAESETDIYQTEMVYQNEQGLNPTAMSHDERYIALVKSINTNKTDMYLLDTQSGDIKQLEQTDENVDLSPQYFSMDDGKLFYLTNEDEEFTYLKSYDLATGDTETIEKADWDIMYAYLSYTGKYRVVAINSDASTEIKIYDETSGELVDLPNMPEGEITSVNISESEKLMSFYASSSKSPSNLYVYNFETQEVKKLSDTMNPEINPDDLVAGEVIRYASFDDMEIPALLYKPKGLAADEKIPVMLYIHGGPGGQTRLNYNPNIQYLVNHGYGILAVNNRGSSGYGKTFFAADDQKHGQDDLQDCIEAKKYLATLDYVDTTKIGIMGGSYGGYMVMAALAFAPEEFAVGVNYFGVTNWLRTLKSTPAWWASFRDALFQEMGNPYEDSVMLYNKSPLFHADQITKPFMVLQGANDPRVLQVESDEIVEAARDNNVPVEYVIFSDEGHGFLKKENNIEANEKVLQFLDKYLKGEENTDSQEDSVKAEEGIS